MVSLALAKALLQLGRNHDHRTDVDDKHKAEHPTGSDEGGTDMLGDDAGEDEGGVLKEGEDGHVKEDQKPITK